MCISFIKFYGLHLMHDMQVSKTSDWRIKIKITSPLMLCNLVTSSEIHRQINGFPTLLHSSYNKLGRLICVVDITTDRHTMN